MKSGAAPLALPPDAGKGKQAVIVAAQWHAHVMEALIAGAREALQRHGMAPDDIHVVRVPGSFELPFGVQKALGWMDGQKPLIVVALGCIIRGETPHFHYIARTVTDALMRLSLKYDVPVGYGLLTTETLAQAEARATPDNNKGREAAEAALALTRLEPLT